MLAFFVHSANWRIFIRRVGEIMLIENAILLTFQKM